MVVGVVVVGVHLLVHLVLDLVLVPSHITGTSLLVSIMSMVMNNIMRCNKVLVLRLRWLLLWWLLTLGCLGLGDWREWGAARRC